MNMTKEYVGPKLKDVNAGEEKAVEKGFFAKIKDNVKDRFKYDIKKIDVIRGKLDIKKPVILQQKALIKAITYCGITKRTQGNIEIMGWLAGKYNKNGSVEIIDAYVGDCKSASAYTELDPLETIKLSKLAKENDLKLIGQWHFHPEMSTYPSGIDDDFMENLEKFGVKTPVQLILNMTDFNLSIMKKGKRKSVEFIIPPKTDCNLDINLGYVNKKKKTFFENNDDFEESTFEEFGLSEEIGNFIGNFIGDITGGIVTASLMITYLILLTLLALGYITIRWPINIILMSLSETPWFDLRKYVNWNVEWAEQ